VNDCSNFDFNKGFDVLGDTSRSGPYSLVEVRVRLEGRWGVTGVEFGMTGKGSR